MTCSGTGRRRTEASPGAGIALRSQKGGSDRCSREQGERLSEKGADRVRRGRFHSPAFSRATAPRDSPGAGSGESNGPSPAPQTEGDLAVAGGDDEQTAGARRHPHDDPPVIHPLQELRNDLHEPITLRTIRGLLQPPSVLSACRPRHWLH